MYDDGVFSLHHERKIRELTDRLAAREWELMQAERRAAWWQWTAYVLAGCAVILLILSALVQTEVTK